MRNIQHESAWQSILDHDTQVREPLGGSRGLSRFGGACDQVIIPFKNADEDFEDEDFLDDEDEDFDDELDDEAEADVDEFEDEEDDAEDVDLDEDEEL